MSRFRWPCGLRLGFSEAHLLRLRVRIPPGTWRYVSFGCCVLSSSGFCTGLITRPEKTYRVCILGLTLVNVTVGHMVEALRYKLEGRGFDSRWCHGKFSLTQSFRPHNGPGFDSASNRNEYQEYFLGVKAAGTWG